MRMRYLIVSCLCVLLFISHASAWKNGPSGNAATKDPSQCANPPYSTHDWIADHALDLLPDEEKEWLLPHKSLYLLATEAPDNKKIPSECNGPHNGYDDRRKGHSVEWKSNFSGFKEGKDRAAKRAQEENNKAIIAYEREEFGDAAFFLGAMAHYIGDVSQYGHAVTLENNSQHSSYEGFVSRKTDSFNEGHFESFIQPDGFRRRTPYTAVKRISKATAKGKGKILSAKKMLQLLKDHKNDPEHLDSIGHSLNLGVNELADVLHTFFLNVVKEEE